MTKRLIKSIEVTKLSQFIVALSELRALVDVDPPVLRRPRQYTQSHVISLIENNDGDVTSYSIELS